MHLNVVKRVIFNQFGNYSKRKYPGLLFSSHKWSHTGRSISSYIVDSPWEDVQVPNVSVTEYVMEKCRMYDKRIAFVNGDSGEEIYYGDLHSRIAKVGSALVRMGIKKGDVITIMATNCPEFAIMYLAAIGIGAVCSAVNPVYTEGELSHALGHSRSKLLATVPDLVPVALGAAKKSPTVEDVIVFGYGKDCVPLSYLLEDDARQFKLDQTIDPKLDLAALPYSSGTTGLPKGVMLTHHCILSNLKQINTEHTLNFTPDDVLIGVLPFFHIYGQVVVMLSGLINGCKTVTLSKFEPQKYLSAIQENKGTYLHVVPPIVLFLAQHPMVESYNLSSVHTAFTAAAPIGAEVVQRCKERIWGSSDKMLFRQGYGLTETSPVTHLHDTDPRNVKYDSIGFPVHNTSCKVVDIETGAALDPGVQGELCVKGPQVMKGYFKNPTATENSIDKDGWFHTGDLAYYDEDKHFYITDRLKELIKYKGFQVAPAELEAVLVSHPAIEDAAVVGIPDERAGELPRAYIVLKQGEKFSDEDVHAYLKGKLAEYKHLSGGVEFREAIPKTASGKILRRHLKSEFLDKK